MAPFRLVIIAALLAVVGAVFEWPVSKDKITVYQWTGDRCIDHPSAKPIHLQRNKCKTISAAALMLQLDPKQRYSIWYTAVRGGVASCYLRAYPFGGHCQDVAYEDIPSLVAHEHPVPIDIDLSTQLDKCVRLRDGVRSIKFWCKPTAQDAALGPNNKKPVGDPRSLPEDVDGRLNETLALFTGALSKEIDDEFDESPAMDVEDSSEETDSELDETNDEQDETPDMEDRFLSEEAGVGHDERPNLKSRALAKKPDEIVRENNHGTYLPPGAPEYEDYHGTWRRPIPPPYESYQEAGPQRGPAAKNAWFRHPWLWYDLCYVCYHYHSSFYGWKFQCVSDEGTKFSCREPSPGKQNITSTVFLPQASDVITHYQTVTAQIVGGPNPSAKASSSPSPSSSNSSKTPEASEALDVSELPSVPIQKRRPRKLVSITNPFLGSRTCAKAKWKTEGEHAQRMELIGPENCLGRNNDSNIDAVVLNTVYLTLGVPPTTVTTNVVKTVLYRPPVTSNTEPKPSTSLETTTLAHLASFVFHTNNIHDTWYPLTMAPVMVKTHIIYPSRKTATKQMSPSKATAVFEPGDPTIPKPENWPTPTTTMIEHIVENPSPHLTTIDGEVYRLMPANLPWDRRG